MYLRRSLPKRITPIIVSTASKKSVSRPSLTSVLNLSFSVIAVSNLKTESSRVRWGMANNFTIERPASGGMGAIGYRFRGCGPAVGERRCLRH